MGCRTTPLACLTFFCIVFTVGCSKTTNVAPGTAEGPVRETFTALQAALKARDVDKLWQLLDSESQDDAERAAKTIQATHAKASAEDKAGQEKALGLPSAELSVLTGKEF